MQRVGIYAKSMAADRTLSGWLEKIARGIYN
jgi:hypothetical protein